MLITPLAPPERAVFLRVGGRWLFRETAELANLTGRMAAGAVVDGPNNVSPFEGGLGGHFPEMNRCPADGVDRYERFTGHNARYVDDVRSWQASEPADDFAATALYASTLQEVR